MTLTKTEIEKLRELEESLWRPETRFNYEYMDKVLAHDFFEFGRSGRIYQREDTLGASGTQINAKLPLRDFQIHQLTDDVVQVTYVSEVDDEELEVGNRSSIWLKVEDDWQLKFHQGTAVAQ
ncbi:MAG: DUF4440 domain-containing protein [Candidatus Andersenbacteria bacterium]